MRSPQDSASDEEEDPGVALRFPALEGEEDLKAFPLPFEKPRWKEVTPVSGSSTISSNSLSVSSFSDAGVAEAAAAAPGRSGVGICSGSWTVSFEARLVLLEDEGDVVPPPPSRACGCLGIMPSTLERALQLPV